LIQNIDFVHLHCHSDYSNLRLLDSINKIPNMIKYVASLGQNALALTDHETISGHVKFLKAVKELKEKKEIPEDFKPILGNEIYLLPSEEEMNEKIENGESVKFYHFLLLAKDKEGHKLIRKLSSRAWGRMFSYKGLDRVPTFHADIEEIVGDNKGHLIASTACLGSYFAQNVLALLDENCKDPIHYKKKIHHFINWCIDMFGKDDFYIEIQPSKESKEQIEYNKMAIKIAKAYGLKFLVSTDAHYLQPTDRNIHKAYLTADEEDGGDREVDEFYHSTHFFTADLLVDYLDYLDQEDLIQAVKNTKEIAEKVEFYDLAHKQIIPRIKLPDETEWFYDENLYRMARQYEYINEMINSDEIYNRYLISQVLCGLKNKIKKSDYKQTFERINIECKETLEISKAKDEPVSSYFITMQKNIDIIWEEAKSIVGTSRGSAAGFIMNYLLGITQINPLKQDGIEMPHWRFISGHRPEYPDIDIDISSHKRDVAFQCLQKYYESIGGKVVRVCTFGTETSKSTILTAARGLGINNDVALYLSSLIPVERGFVWSIEDCYYGNEEKGRQPVADFKKTIDKYEGLLEVALGIQGLINKRSSHAAGVLIVNEDFTERNAIMQTPSKEIVSQFNLEDSEYVGNIKYDILNTKTCSMIQVTLEMLIEYGKIEWQGSLRKTYDKYLHPDVIDRTTPEMWQLLNDGKLISAFQFDELSGIQALRVIKPSSLLEATNANTVMRLMGEGEESPLEKYGRYKNNINEWYSDMRDFGLSEEDIKIVEKHLLEDYGVCSSQEKMMLLAMDKEIAGFDVVEANKLRKGVAKKKADVLEECKQMLYEKGRALGTSQKLLEYIWEVQIAMQRGYGFSILHGIGYTYILIQQLNLIYYYPPIYWNTAVLLVESGALEQETLDEDDEDES
jgi:DNA polymerase-3 subunit alpha